VVNAHFAKPPLCSIVAQEMAGYLGVLKKRATAEILKPVAAAKSAAAPVEQ